MTNIPQGYERILVATDFSPHAEAALKQAVWLARQNGAKIVVMHTLPGEPFGVLLGNTAERILDTCDGSILAVKPADFVSPIAPFVSPLPPGSAEEVP